VKVLGVDPGGSGALALLHDLGLLIVDMPVFLVKRGKSSKAELDTHALIATLDGWAPDVCYFEQVGGIPGQSAPAAFNFGRIAGACEALVKASGARFVFVTPAVWKRAMGVSGDKDDARAKATNMFPANAADFRRKKDDGRAEAALLAAYGRRLEATSVFS
jgi:crossover junction endodeoxyribonuclease RuvC